MKFSVLIPVYNVEKYLAKCLESLDCQTFRDFESVLVDDGSTDKSGEIIDRYATQRESIKVFHKKNEGLVSARLKALEAAEGDYCIFLDSDDFLENDALEKINGVISKTATPDEPEIIVFNAFEYDGKEKKVFFEHTLLKGPVEDKKLIYEEYLTTYRLNPICLKAVKRSLFDLSFDYSRFYDCNFGEDLLWSLPITKVAGKIYYLDECLYNYRQMSGMMHSFNTGYFASYKKVGLEMERLLSDENIPDFSGKLDLFFLRAAYGGITRLKYGEKSDYGIVSQIMSDKTVEAAYAKKQNRKQLGSKQRLILHLAAKRRLTLIRLLLSLKK